MPSMYRVRAATTGWLGAPGLNTFYFECGDTSGSDEDATLCAVRVRDAFLPTVLNFPTTWTCNVSAVVDILTDTTGELTNSRVVTTPAPVVGTGAGVFGPSPVTALLRLRTNTFSDGRRIQGRAFLGPIVANSDADGSPVSSVLARFVTMGEELLDIGIGEGPSLVVWRRPRLFSEGPPEIEARVGSSARVITTSVPDKFAVLRSRRD